jgi:hypothetical protein
MGRTVCLSDEISRRARYGRIQPMDSERNLRWFLTRLNPFVR